MGDEQQVMWSRRAWEKWENFTQDFAPARTRAQKAAQPM
jgi:hypothetical protein